MFEDDRAIQLKTRSQRLMECFWYLDVIVKDNKGEELNVSVCRSLFYDRLLPSGKELMIPDACADIACKWEIVVGMMYFTSGLEMFLKYMLEQLNEPLTITEWISQTLKQSDFNWDIQKLLSSVVGEWNS